MNVFKVTKDGYYMLIRTLAGFVFHRIDADGNYLIMPLKRVEKDVTTYLI